MESFLAIVTPEAPPWTASSALFSSPMRRSTSGPTSCPLGCAITYGAYVMPDRWINSTLHQYFVPVAVFNTFVCTGLSCYSRFPELEHPKFSKILRTVAFVYPFLFDNIPLFYRLLFCCGEGCAHNDTSFIHCQHLLFAFLACFLFASHLPERLAPGRFDYIGHSHQLFHICAVVGTHFQMEAILADMASRHSWLSRNTPAPSFQGTLGTAAFAVLGNLLIISIFTGTLLWSPNSNSILQNTFPEGSGQKKQ
nr:PREDICTED: progestin and adipoQ receptor family member 6 [Latimeria chalumnae]|eukprot:XP_006005172.1 PREDICTED: progestin and adipoQ receptor family member 6 [Latimeria chalumnae]